MLTENIVTRLYPPQSANALKTLLSSILENSRLDRLKKYSFIFYLYLDESPTAASELASRLQIPEHFVTMISAFHSLDWHQFVPAMAGLTHPAVFPNYTAQILNLLTFHSQNRAEGAKLATIFAQVSARPGEARAGDPEYNAYFEALKQTDISMAFRVLRGMFPDETPEKKEYLRSLTEFCLSTKVPPTERSDRAMKFLALPFTVEENTVVERWLQDNSGEIVKDTLILKKMFSGRWAEAFEDVKANPGKRIDGISWDDLTAGVQDRLGPRLNVES